MRAMLRSFCLIALLVAGPADAETLPPFNILITNDDGISSEGIEALVAALRPIGTVIVAAPAANNSGIGQALTLFSKPLKVSMHTGEDGVKRYRVEGTPADCVVFGLLGPESGRKFDLVVSGINKGENVGKVAFVSGTVGAARQAVLMGVPAIAVSLEQRADEQYDFTAAARFTAGVAREMWATGTAPRIVSINVPTTTRGVKLVPPAASFVEFRPLVKLSEGRHGATGYRAEYRADFVGMTPAAPETDAAVMADGYIAVSFLGTSVDADPAEAALGSKLAAIPAP